MRHVHDGKWFTTWQSAFCPHVPGHGSWHLFRTHARFDAQSELRTHSGRHPSYGLPKYSGKHWHAPAPFCSRQMAFEPHGFGTQGCIFSRGGSCCRMLHWVNGSPSYPSIQTHTGEWLTTLHSALWPQVPGQGSRHFWLIHANEDRHSELLIHSGRQFGGNPENSGRQEHDGESPTALHSEFGPHGDG